MKIICDFPDNAKEIQEQLVNGTEPAEMYGKVIGRGSHDIIQEITGTDLCLKLFLPKAVAGKYFDYKYLEKLIGIKVVPLMYAYKELCGVIMERVKGMNLLNYLFKYKAYPYGIKDKIAVTIEEIYLRKIFMPDLKVFEDIIWVEEINGIKIIDYSICDDMSHMSDNFIRGCMRDTLEEYMTSLTYKRN